MLMRKDSVLKGMFLAFALLLFICIAEDATVFAAPDPSIEKAGEDAVRLLAHFKAQSDKVRVYQTALRKAGAEDREVLQLQLALLQDSLLKDVHQLVDALVDLEDEEGRQSGVRPKVALVMTQTSRRLREMATQLRNEIDKVRERRTGSAPAERLVIENDMAKLTQRLDQIYIMSYDHLQKMKTMSQMGESSVDFIVRPWVNVADYWDVYWDVTRAVKKRFDAEGVSIPFPQRDVHLYGSEPKG